MRKEQLRLMLVGLIGLLLIIARAEAQQLKDVYNPFTGNRDFILSDAAYETRAAYTSGNTLEYEGWAYWKSTGNLTSEEVWRISKLLYTSGNLTRIVFAGDGYFDYAWDDRESLFVEASVLEDMAGSALQFMSGEDIYGMGL